MPDRETAGLYGMPLKMDSCGRRFGAHLTRRRVLVLVVLIAIALGWMAVGRVIWLKSEAQNQKLFLERFKASFRSGRAALAGEPQIAEIQRVLIRESGYRVVRPSECNEYRITAPVKIDGVPRWRVWSYVCNDDHDDGIYGFACADAPSRDRLPSHPYPMAAYIQWSTETIDGIPITAGPAATIISVTAPAAIDQPVRLVAEAAPGTVCELEIFPSDARLSSIPPQSPDSNGRIEWAWHVNPKYVGQKVRVIVKCREKYGAGEFVNSTEAPPIELPRAGGDR